MISFLKNIFNQQEAVDLQHVEKLLLFIGTGRTGSTLLGQILNYHPECLIATESRFVQKIINNECDLSQGLNFIARDALSQFESGLENDKKFSKTLHKWQEKWIPMKDLNKKEEFIKQKIKVIGDKKAGGTTQFLLNHPADFKSKIEDIQNMHFLHLIRHPIHTTLSHMKAHDIKDFKQAALEIISSTMAAYQLGQRYENYLLLEYEDLLFKTEEFFKPLETFLGIKFDAEWVNSIKSVLNTSPLKETSEYSAPMTEVIEELNAKEIYKNYLPFT